MRGIKGIGIILIIILGIGFVSSAQNMGMDHMMENFKGHFKEMNVNGHINMDGSVDEEKAISMLKDISRRLNMEEIKIENNSDENIVQINGFYHKGDYNMSLIIQSNKGEDIKETNIVIDYTSEKKESMEKIKEKISEGLKEYGEINYYTSFIGTYNKKMTKEEKRDVVKNLIDTYKIRVEEEYEDKNIVSITGYTKNFKKWIQYGGKKVNINIAMRYNNYDGKTYVIMGYPLITIGY
ncbi:MAG: YwmB family TATA-box binding protein [Anaeromicrobium sp.]|jgi:hypothetical protein|uniref:YwmB family TATA-box binding protein n=1 Tax=Anaeromicrobium sp. TaxID=1929132 RepID=UPI0025E90FF3|nr:YwmB family TATA-box binding protein [Anaeromicrobium sp.]MCT4593937.1 YwmB family TATA-box binding protein [Anaeromicrobium sp.]